MNQSLDPNKQATERYHMSNNSSSAQDFRDRLIAFYALYNPSCVNSVDAILATYKDREEDLLQVLVAKYGPEPGLTSSAALKSRHQYPVSALEQLARNDDLPLLRHQDTLKLAEESPPPHREGWGTTAAEENAKRSTSGRNESHPMKPRNASPPSETSSVAKTNSYAAIAAMKTQQHQSSLLWPQRFYNYYCYYRPDKVGELERKLAQHQGREAEWMAQLVMKYGPEPPPRQQTVAPRVEHNQAPSIDPSFDFRVARNSAMRPAMLKSPSPPGHPIHQPFLAQRFENPEATNVVDDGALSEVVARLTDALDTKTREVVTLKGVKAKLADEVAALNAKLEQERLDCRKESDALREEVKQLKTTGAILQKKADEFDRMQQQHESDSELKSTIDRLSSTVAMREYQNRMLRIQKEQTEAELTLKEKHHSDLSNVLKEYHIQHKKLIEENGALKLAVIEPSSEQRFYKVVEEIQDTCAKAFDHRKKLLETEMQQYYEYAKQQISHRDSIIQQLNEQLTALATGVIPSHSFLPTVTNGGAVPTERALAEEVSRLKLQLSIQNEEYKILLASSRSKGIDAPFQRNDAELQQLRLENEKLAREVRNKENEASSARVALQAELQRQVEEMKDVHQRVAAYEAEKGQLRDTIQELQRIQHVNAASSETAQPSASGVEARPYTKTNMWSLLYER